MDEPRKRPRVYTIARAASAIGVSKRTMWRLIASDKIRTVKVSIGRRGVPDEEIERVRSHGVCA